MSYLIYNEGFKLWTSANEVIKQNLRDTLDQIIKSNMISEFILIVPTKRIVRYLEKQIIKEYFDLFGKPVRRLRIFNLEDFLLKLFNTYFELNKSLSKTPLIVTESLRIVLTEEAFNNSDLEYFKFSKSKVKLEVIRKLSELIYGLREDGFTSKQIITGKNDEFNEKYEVTDHRKNNDIQKLIIEYENLLAESLYDIPRIYEILNSYGNKSSSENFEYLLERTFGINARFILAGFSDFKMPEVQFLCKFSKVRFPLNIFLDYSDNNGPLFGNFQEVISQFDKADFEVRSDDELFEDYSQENYEIDNFFLRKYLFNYKSDLINKNLEKYVNIFQVINSDDEFSKVTKLVKFLNLKKGIPLKDIVIVSRRPEDYSEGLRETFRKERIAVNISDRPRLSTSVVVNSFMNLIKLSVEFDLDLLLKVLSCGYFYLDKEINVENLFKTSKILRIKSFYYSYNSDFILQKAKSFIEFSKNKLLSKELDWHEVEKYKANIQNTELFIEDLTYLTRKFSKVKERLTSNEFLIFIFQKLVDFKVSDNLNHWIKNYLSLNSTDKIFDLYSSLEDLEAENSALDKFIKLSSELAETLNQRNNDKQFSLKYWLERLQIAVSVERFQVKEKINYGVSITSIEQIRMIPYKVKILCGVNDGIFPSIYSGEQIIGRELKDSKRRHARSERVLFYQFLSNSNSFFNSEDQEIYIFHYLMKNGEKQSPSPFIENLLKISNLASSGKVINLYGNISGDYIELFDQLSWIHAISTKSELVNYLLEKKYKFENIQTSNWNSKQMIEQDDYEYLLCFNSVKQPITLNEKMRDEIKAHSYSISEIEMYAKCAYKYFASKILRVDAPDQVEENISNLEKGNLLHTVLFRFYNQLLNSHSDTFNINLKRNNGDVLPLEFVKLNPQNRNKYQELILELIKEELSNPVYNHPFIHLETKNLEISNANKNLLLLWLEYELEKIIEGWDFYPFAFECTKRTILDSNLYYIDKNEKISFNIKADKAELKLDGEKYVLAISDYKLSSSSISKNQQIIQDFSSFQMPLYLAVFTQDFLSQGIEVHPGFGAYTIIYPKPKEFGKRNIHYVLMDNNELVPQSVRPTVKTTSEYLENISTKGAIDRSVIKVFEIHDKILSGNFPLTDKIPSNCNYCNYESLCRKRQISQF